MLIPVMEVRYIRSRDELSRILKACHATSGHLGVKGILARITERFKWPGIAKDVDKLIG